MGNRNSFSKTDHDATFMRMKEDAMNNGQTKPGNNLQIGTEVQFITDFGMFQSPGDTFTMIPFCQSFDNRYGKFPQASVADAGYGSEENYRFMDEAGIEAFVKYNMFHKSYEPDPFSPQAMFYNADGDYCVCPMGQHLTRIGTTKSKTENGYGTESACYKAQRCQGCPLRGGGLCAMRVAPTDTYATLKARLVKLRYSLDDQMAVMLNADPDELAAMQAWRDWAADIAP